MGEHLSPLSLKWLRTLRNRYIEIGTGIPEDHIPKRAVAELNKAGKIYRDALGNIVYIVQLDEELGVMYRTWDKWRTKRDDQSTSGMEGYTRSIPFQKR